MIAMTQRAAERAGLVAKKNKHGAIRDGAFDSRKEAARFAELKLLERIGQIYNLKAHPVYHLTVNGKIIGSYEADATYNLSDGAWIVEDTKALDKKTGKYRMTPLAKRNIAHLEAQHGIKVRIV